jgi:hypothetical protein
MTEIEKFENLKKKIDNLNIKKMASESEYNRLNEELNNIKKDIKDVYGVEIEEFANAINIMKEKYTSTLNELEILVSEAEEKIGNK